MLFPAVPNTLGENTEQETFDWEPKLLVTQSLGDLDPRHCS